MSIDELYQLYLQHPAVCTDTRKIMPGCLFFALKGENFNGNDFALQALSSGAAYAIVDEDIAGGNEKILQVDNTLHTLQELARHHRMQLKIPFIGITGTNGKTTTKELIYSVLSQKYKTQATQGNLNNHIGVPLTLLSIRPDTEMAIIEMGANHQGEIDFLCSMARPTHGIITNVGKAHLEGFGSFEGVKKAKGELYNFLQQSGGTAFINGKNQHLLEMSRRHGLKNRIFYSEHQESLIKGHLPESDPFLMLEWNYADKNHRVQTNLTGAYNLENMLAAVAIGIYFKLSAEEINAGITAYTPANNRSQIIQTAANTVICDYYNANPSSMAAALTNFSALRAAKKVLILGDMFELGNESASEHQALLNQAAGIPAHQKIFVGSAFYQLKGTIKGDFFETTDEAFQFLSASPVTNSMVLMKGSRGMKLEKLIPLL